MKCNVKISTYSVAMTIITLIALIAIMIARLERGHEITAYILAVIIVVSCFTALFYTPMTISATGSGVEINRSLRIKSLPYSEIESVRLCPPTMAEKRLFASGGFFGYWGWFSEPGIGKYFAYYGKSSDCFLITLKSGKKYVLGCEKAPEMVEYINSQLHKNDRHGGIA